MKTITKEMAIKALCDLVEKAFGHDKGSGDAYQEWCADYGLCEYYDPLDEENQDIDSIAPPHIEELLIISGVNPKDIIEFTGINEDLIKTICKYNNIVFE